MRQNGGRLLPKVNSFREYYSTYYNDDYKFMKLWRYFYHDF